MRMPRLIVSGLKLLVLLAIAGGLYFYSRSREKDLPIIDDDDVNVTQQVTVQTGKIERRTLRQYEDVYGIVEAEPARNGKPAAGAVIAMPATAMVASVNCTEGSRVKAGDVLLKLDPRASQAEVDRATAVYNSAVIANSDNSLANRDKLRLQRDVADAEAALAPARSALDRLAIPSPVSGTVLRLNIRAGEVAVAGSAAMEIADEDRLVIACSVPAWSRSAVAVGAPAEAVYVDAEGAEHNAPGKVSFIDPGVDAASASASVDVALDSHDTTQPSFQLRVGQTLHVRLITNQHDALAVPEESVVEDAQGNATISLVERDFRWAVRHTVQTGLRDAGWVEVRAPELAAGKDVVTVGAFALTDNCRIEVTR